MPTRRLLLAGGAITVAGVAALAIAPTLTVGAFETGARPPVKLADYGPAPEIVGIDRWINAPPQTVAALKGKVVLIDFWTYGCINCVRSLPHVRGWHEHHARDGLVVIGVHTPEFPFERDRRGLEAAIRRHGLTYPVGQDNRYATWSAYENQYWPAVYLIDRRGRLVLKHFGEGDYDAVEAAIQTLLAQPATD